MRPSEERIEEIWSAAVKPTVFGKSEHDPAPLTVFLGGQPGAGKTAGAKTAQALNPEHQITPIIGDDYREFHPDYFALVQEDPLSMPSETSHAEGEWIGMCVSHADREDYSVSIEGTWRNPATVLDEAARAKRLGRSTHAVIVAVPYLLSRIRALERFVSGRAENGKGRWTPPTAQEKVVENLSESVRKISLSPDIDRFTVVGSRGIVFDSLRDARAMGWQAWHAEFDRPLSPEERTEAKEKITSMRRAVDDLGLGSESRDAVTKELDTVARMYERRQDGYRKTIGIRDFRRMITDQTRFDRTRHEQERGPETRPRETGGPTL